MKSADPTNYPIQVGSLTAGACGNIRSQCAVTKSPEGKFVCYEQMTRSQSERQGKDIGCSKANDCRHRKGEPASMTDRAGDFGRLSFVLWEKPAIIREENGYEHLMTRRCKRRRHVLRVHLSNWGEPVCFQKRDRVLTKKGVVPDENNQDYQECRSSWWSGINERLGINHSIRRNAESCGKGIQEVGDDHSSEDSKDTITLLSEGSLA